MVAFQSGAVTLYHASSDGAPAAALMVREAGPARPPKPRLLDRVREAVRARHYSRRTEKTYVAWVRRYILFHGKRHPAEMGAAEVTRYLTSLAVEGNVAASTQNQALSALLFLYRNVLEQDLPWLDNVGGRPDAAAYRGSKRLPVPATNARACDLLALELPTEWRRDYSRGREQVLLACADLRVSGTGNGITSRFT